MSDKRKYTAEDIRLYLEGKLSPAEMHAIERASLDDPFLADAIEGMQQYGNNEKFALESARLKDALNERVKKKKRIIDFPVQMLWKIAAVLVVVVTGVAIIVYTGEKNDTSKVEIAKTEKQARKPDAAAPATAQDSGVRSFPAPKDSQKEQSSVTRESRSLISPDRHLEDELDDTSPAPQASALATEAAPALVDSVPATRNDDEVSKALQGRVPGVDASVQRKAKTASDTSNAGNANSDLNEVVVVGYGNTSSKNRYNSPLANNRTERRITPQGGWLQFEQYLDRNRKPNAYDTTLRGIEKLSFVIDRSGAPSLITIIHSISPEHDRELIRLITEGPAWEVKRGSKRKVVLSVIF